MSRTTEIIKFLQNYNAWRRGDETLEMPHPAEIGMNIQDAVVILREHDELKQRAERAEAELADQTKRFHDEIVCRQETVRNNHELNLRERDHLLDLLAIERARTTKLAERMLRFAAEYYPPNEAGEIDFVRATLESYAEEMKEGAK
jgi:hypothetical protein